VNFCRRESRRLVSLGGLCGGKKEAEKKSPYKSEKGPKTSKKFMEKKDARRGVKGCMRERPP